MSPVGLVRPEPYWLVALALAVGDQLTKYLVGTLGAVFEFGPLVIGRVINTVGVFGWPLANSWLVVAGTLIAVVILATLLTVPARPPARLGLWLLFGGVVSNLIDRVTVGGVIDIIGIVNLTRFNLADVMIILGALSLLRTIWWRER